MTKEEAVNELLVLRQLMGLLSCYDGRCSDLLELLDVHCRKIDDVIEYIK